MSQESYKITPLMQQYFELRAKFPEALLLFQVGDFFELFFDDAVKAAAFLNITLTKRGMHQGEPIPLCGVPVHMLEIYLAKLVKGGFRVAICEQLEQPTPGKVVRRGVTRVLTPGTLVESNLLDDKSASYFCSVFPTANSWGLLFGELLTMQLFATTLPSDGFKSLEAEISRFLPDEILLPANKLGKQLQSFFKALGYATAFQAEVDSDAVRKWLDLQFQDPVRQKLQQLPAVFGALQGLYAYLERCQKPVLGQFNAIRFYEPENYLILDAATQRHLELVRNSYDGGRSHSLLELIDHSVTAMGSRLIKKWLMRPLVDSKLILARQQGIAFLVSSLVLRERLVFNLKQVSDLERVVGRIVLERGVLADYLQLKQALGVLPQIKQLLGEFSDSELLWMLGQQLSDFQSLYLYLNQALNDDSTQDWLIKLGFDHELDHVRTLVHHASQKIIELEKSEQQATGITSLKIRYNQVQGYYIEITKPNLHLVPPHYLRQQTLVGKERFMTPGLQQLQMELDHARENIGVLESAIFEKVKAAVFQAATELRKATAALAQLDALVGLANSAYAYGYVKPTFNDQLQIKIDQGRHPVVEQTLEGRFIPNDTYLTRDQSLWIITGPNMGGKSTYLRQVAVICVLAQCGSFVPAKEANLPILDRIFTRIGASDHLVRGQSTFLVEMDETALICAQATKKSLVILDEVGRGTSTFDGLAIAQAVVEYIYEQIGAFCLFATHYHELTTLTEKFMGIANYHAASESNANGIVLLHRIVPGVADGSFGVEVAKAAALPKMVIQRAEQLLQEFEVQQSQFVPARLTSSPKINHLQEQVLSYKKLVQAIETIDLNELSPRAAFDLLWSLKQQLAKFES